MTLPGNSSDEDRDTLELRPEDLLRLRELDPPAEPEEDRDRDTLELSREQVGALAVEAIEEPVTPGPALTVPAPPPSSSPGSDGGQ